MLFNIIQSCPRSLYTFEDAKLGKPKAEAAKNALLAVVAESGRRLSEVGS